MSYIKAAIAMTLDVHISRSFVACSLFKWDVSYFQDSFWQAHCAAPLQ